MQRSRRARLAPALAAGLAAALAAAGAPQDPAAGGPALAPDRDGGPGASEELAAALALPGDPVRGRRAYEPCASCHLPSGAGRADGTFPQLAGQHRSVLVKQLVDIRTGRRSNPVMAPYARALLDAQEIADVTAYVAALPRPSEQGLGEGRDLARGGALYARDCARCHGAGGEGDAARIVPALAGQHYAYLLRQVRSISSGLRGNAHPEMASLVAGYSDAELRAVVDYASRLRDRGVPAAEP
jgi:cytochrome c553